MTDVNSLIAEVRRFVDNPGWSPYRLAREAGLGPSTLAALYDKESVWRPRADILQRCLEVVRRHSRCPVSGQMEC